jgi:hypothetical protein
MASASVESSSRVRRFMSFLRCVLSVFVSSA